MLYSTNSSNKKNSQTWNPLKKGDKVEVIAPSSGVSKLELKRALKFLEEWDLVPKLKKNLINKDLLCSNSLSFRFKHIQQALKASDSKVIFCLRGGYGSNHLLSHLESIKRPSFCKLLVGFSDITFLHSFLNYKWKWPSLHASNLIYLVKPKNKKNSSIQKIKAQNKFDFFIDSEDIMNLKEILFGEKEFIEIKDLKPLNQKAKEVKSLRSSLAGGNLRILTSLIGTPWIQSLNSKIVILEDTNERAYFIDRMFFQWKESGLLKKVKALILGNFLTSKEKNKTLKEKKEALLLKQVIQKFAENSKIPIFKTSAFGHGKRQTPLPLLTKASLFPLKKENNRPIFSLKIDTP